MRFGVHGREKGGYCRGGLGDWWGMGKTREECRKTRETDVSVNDTYGDSIALGAIVEIVSNGYDRYKGLYYVVGFEADGEKGIRLLLARSRWDIWDFKVKPFRVRLRCNDPVRQKGEM